MCARLIQVSFNLVLFFLNRMKCLSDLYARDFLAMPCNYHTGYHDREKEWLYDFSGSGKSHGLGDQA